jgi:predicted RNA binding protein YcfA (HicA-like mRNA interferase family)
MGAPHAPFSLYIMTTKKLTKLATIHGWTKKRNGSKHMIWEHVSSNQQITIPYQVKSTVYPRIAKQLERCAT